MYFFNRMTLLRLWGGGGTGRLRVGWVTKRGGGESEKESGGADRKVSALRHQPQGCSGGGSLGKLVMLLAMKGIKLPTHTKGMRSSSNIMNYWCAA